MVSFAALSMALLLDEERHARFNLSAKFNHPAPRMRAVNAGKCGECGGSLLMGGITV